MIPSRSHLFLLLLSTGIVGTTHLCAADFSVFLPLFHDNDSTGMAEAYNIVVEDMHYGPSSAAAIADGIRHEPARAANAAEASLRSLYEDDSRQPNIGASTAKRADMRHQDRTEMGQAAKRSRRDAHRTDPAPNFYREVPAAPPAPPTIDDEQRAVMLQLYLSTCSLGSPEKALEAISRVNERVCRHRNYYGMTLMQYAADVGNPEFMKALKAKGARINTTDTQGTTPLHRAARAGHLPAVIYLVEQGAKLDTQTTIVGETPLMMAARGSHMEKPTVRSQRVEVIHYLCRKGGLPLINAEDTNRLRAADIARIYRQQEAAQALEQAYTELESTAVESSTAPAAHGA